MNRIILIGNGFDLAHGMPTKYSDFIDDYWGKAVGKMKAKITKNKMLYPYEGYSIDDANWSIYNQKSIHFPEEIKTYQGIKDWERENYDHHVKFTLKNEFLQRISEKSSLTNWIDIEQEYFENLKELLNTPVNRERNIERLNKNFDRITDLLKEYIDHLDKKQKTSSIIQNQINETINIENDFSEAFSQTINTVYNKRNPAYQSVKKEQYIEKYMGIQDNLETALESILLLNFNYTDTEKLYSNNFNIQTETIHIHGNLKEEQKNPIIFGYGDEVNEDYKQMESLNNKDLLTHIKSVRYHDTDNYKRLLQYINSDHYQVFIMGHSCGLSDRTLLKTLFEHKNCVSIKPFYHEYEEEENGKKIIKDNYREIVMNITRYFDSTLGEKVVNKTYCEPLGKQKS